MNTEKVENTSPPQHSWPNCGKLFGYIFIGCFMTILAQALGQMFAAQSPLNAWWIGMIVICASILAIASIAGMATGVFICSRDLVIKQLKSKKLQ